MAITIVGLGPGDARLITRDAWSILTNSEHIYVRTARHPAVSELPDSIEIHSFDEVYETAENFAAVYQTIAQKLLEIGKKESVVYAVPGHPLMGESTVLAITAQAQQREIDVKIINGMSFLEPLLTTLALKTPELAVDGMDGVQVFDAITIAGSDYPPVNPDRPLILGQLYSRILAGELKLALEPLYNDEHPVVLIHGAGTDEEVVESVPLYQIDHSDNIAHLTTLYVPPRPARSDMTALAEVIATLRGPNGCPWDIEQTPQTMRRGFIEEAAELLEALDMNDPQKIAEELGDVLLHVVMQAQMAAEDGLFTLADVIQDIVAKLIRRHPHVWGEADARDSGAVLANWKAIKAQERAERGEEVDETVLHNIPAELPALARALKIQKRVAEVGFDWQEIGGVYDKLGEEILEVQSAADEKERTAEVGDLLFAAVNLARWLGVNPEIALRDANLRFTRRFRGVEELAQAAGRSITELDEAEMDRLWREVKRQHGKSNT